MWDFIVKYKWWIIAIVVLIIIIVIARRRGGVGNILKSQPKPGTEDGGGWGSTSSTTPTYTGTPSAGNCMTDASFPLKVGSKGKQVGALQKFINDVPKNTTKITVDCDFGPQTLDKVKQGIFKDQVSKADYISYNIAAWE